MAARRRWGVLDVVQRRLAMAGLDLEVVRVERLTGGEVNTTVRAWTADGAELVVRCGELADWHPSRRGQAAAMDLARSLGIPVPDVVHAGEVFVQQYVAGAAMSADPPAGLAEAAGRLVGRLHTQGRDGPGPVQPDGSSPCWPPDTFTRSVREEAARVLSHDSPLLDPDVLLAAVELVCGQPPSTRARLVHGDAQPKNVIVRDGQIVALIDFDDAWFADPAVDLAWWWWAAPASSDAFARGCAAVSEPTDEVAKLVHRLRLLIGLADSFAASDVARGHRIAALLPGEVSALRALVG